MKTFQYIDTVRKEWVDYNGHMNDAAYAQVFSLGVDSLMTHIGLDEEGREKHHYTIFTLETHLVYLQEAHEGEELQLELQLLDYDEKRLHVFFRMVNSSGELLAVSEQMLMGMDQRAGKPAAFPEEIAQKVFGLWEEDKQKSRPEQAGRMIGIKKK
ncbi:MAG: thioesterase [Alkalicoccus sp.]|nr:MAG: thioesterase [Alkalicoccus sp.]